MRYQTAPRPDMSDGFTVQSGRPESNRLWELGRLQCNRYTSPALKAIIGLVRRAEFAAIAALRRAPAAADSTRDAASHVKHLSGHVLGHRRPRCDLRMRWVGRRSDGQHWDL